MGFGRQKRERVFIRDDYRCVYCGRQYGRLTVDHRFPKSQGGSDHISNLVTACFKCNMAKGDMCPQKFLESVVSDERT